MPHTSIATVREYPPPPPGHVDVLYILAIKVKAVSTHWCELHSNSIILSDLVNQVLLKYQRKLELALKFPSMNLWKHYLSQFSSNMVGSAKLIHGGFIDLYSLGKQHCISYQLHPGYLRFSLSFCGEADQKTIKFLYKILNVGGTSIAVLLWEVSALKRLENTKHHGV